MGQRLIGIGIAATVALSASASCALAQMKQVIFEDRPVQGHFSKSVAEQSEGITLLRDWDVTPPQEDLIAPPTLEESEGLEQSKEIPTTREQILSRFGSPQEEAPVQAVSDAPKSFQGIMAALNAGDDRLAYEYAKQYARYMDKLGRLQDKAVSVQTAAMMKEGLRDIEALDDDRSVQPFRHFVLEDLQKEKHELHEEPVGRLVDLLPAEIKGDVLSFEKRESQDLLYSEEGQKRKVKQLLAQRVRPFPAGQVDVYLFVRPLDPHSTRLAQELRRLAQESLTDSRLNFVASALHHEERGKIDLFKSRVGNNFPFVEGGVLAELFQVTEAPTVVLTHSNGSVEPLRISGFRRGYFIEALVELAQGRMK